MVAKRLHLLQLTLVIILITMFILEFKAVGKTTQYQAIDEAIRTVKFIHNKSLRFWMDNKGVGQKDLYFYSTLLRKEFSFVAN